VFPLRTADATTGRVVPKMRGVLPWRAQEDSMPQPPVLLARRPHVRAGSVLTWFAGIASFALLAYVIFGVAHQITTAPPPLRLVLVHDIPLPSGLGTSSVGTSDPLAPGVAVPFDRFDFQAY